MARRGILDYVLGGAVGGLEGLAQQRAAEDEKKRLNDALMRQQGIDAESSRRQAMMDALALGEKGFTEAGVRQERTKAATPAIGAMLSQAMSMGRGAVPSGVLPDLSAIEKAAGMYGRPVQSFEVGGKTYEKTLTKEQEAAMGLSREEEARNRQLQQAERVKAAEAQRVAEAKNAEMSAMKSAWEAAGLSPAKADVAARTGAKYGDVYMSDKDLQSLGISRDQLKLAQDRFKLDQEKVNATSPASEIEKRLPVGARNDIADYNAAIRTLQEAQKEVANNPGAFGIRPVLYAKGGMLGRSMREKSEGEKSEAYTKARAQMQSALMKLRKTQFGTQMTKLEKDTGEEVFPSGAESSKRLTQMLSVLVGNAEQLRRGVYEANNAPDLYTPIAPDTQTTTPTPPAAKPATAGSGGRKPALTIDQWMDANPQRAGESDEAYMARARTSREGK
jgi:hypothetical protein